MTRTNLVALVSLLAGLLGPAAHAQQTAPSGQAQAGQSPPGRQAPSYSAPAAEPPGSGTPQPVIFATSVEVLRSDRAGGLDVVRVRGLVTSGNWGQPHLIPITAGRPRDGMLDLVFMATAPAGAQPLGPFMVVEAILPVESGHPYKGVRVRAGNNAISLKTLPGYAETPAPKEDCASCLGKYFVAKGASPPAGVAAGDVVREADLPYTLRIIKPTDGIPSYAFEPNRLTLLLSEDGRIVDAAWD